MPTIISGRLKVDIVDVKIQGGESVQEADATRFPVNPNEFSKHLNNII